MASQLKQACQVVTFRLAGTLTSRLQLRHELQGLDTSKRCFAAESDALFARELQTRIAALEVSFRFVPDIIPAPLVGKITIAVGLRESTSRLCLSKSASTTKVRVFKHAHQLRCPSPST